MLPVGRKIKYFNREATVLLYSEDEGEVLLFIDKDYVKWVDKSFIEPLE